eukprot:gene12813-11477_t
MLALLADSSCDLAGAGAAARDPLPFSLHPLRVAAHGSRLLGCVMGNGAP